ncbi:terpene synthase-like [Ptiloglossa arizonensis]|uniref:terpene synthase-like n=1 Tax=Ptiloglossa arizonensis TaxID=3350558 RepID=UPI003FA0DBF5
MDQMNQKAYSLTGDPKEDQILLEPFNYIFRTTGNEIGPKWGEAFNYWLKVPKDKFDAILDTIQILHTFTLLLDDIQDNSVLRSGGSVSQNVYGLGVSLNSLSYGVHIGLERIFALNHPEGVPIYAAQVMEFYRGQGIEIYWRHMCICPTETEYKKMVIRKASIPFTLSVRLLQLFSNCKKDFSSLINTISVYYQIRNDYFDLHSKKFAEDKTFAEDVSTGNFNFLIIHAIQSHPEDKQILNILKQRTNDINVKRYCVSLLERFGSFAYTRTVLGELDKKIREEIQGLGGNPLLVEILDDLLDWNPVAQKECGKIN